MQSNKTDRLKVLICDCEKTMHMNEDELTKACEDNYELSFHNQLCRRQIKSYEDKINTGSCLVACTQEAPLFLEIAEENQLEENVRFVNIRERAGWSSDAQNITAKMAALLAEASYKSEPSKVRTIESDGLCYIYGDGQVAIDAAIRLSKHLPVSLILKRHDNIILPEVVSVPIFKGDINTLSGSLGSFQFSVEDYATMNPSSKETLQFSARKNTNITCSLFFDLAGDTPLINAHEKRDGYYRADPGNPLAVSETLFDIIDMVGTFEKPIYVEYDSHICAHSRSRITGCSNCIEACATGAIVSSGDNIVVDAQICAGCGSCAAVCPTGAISYTVPDRKSLVERIQILANNYLEAGGKRPVLLVHDETHGMPLVSAIARYGKGLPGHVIPLSLYSVTLLGHDIFATALAAGFESVVVLCNPAKKEELIPLDNEITITRDILQELSIDHDPRLIMLIEDNPDTVESNLYEIESIGGLQTTHFRPLGNRREIARSAISALVKSAKSSVEVIPLSENAPYGSIAVDDTGCTLCLACVSSCPINALADNPEQPQLRFTEAACVQCGLCKSTCPENVITLKPRLNLKSSAMQPLTLYEEKPFECIRCGNPFASKSTIERMVEKLSEAHWMYEGNRANLLKMCDTCKIETQAEDSGGDPFAYGKRPKTITSQDYIEADEQGLTIEDFLKKQSD